MPYAANLDDKPRISLDSLQFEAPELSGRVPMFGRLARVMAGSDRPDYCLLVLDDAVPFVPPESFDWQVTQEEFRGTTSIGIPFLWINAVIICSRIVGEQISATMRNLQVNLAYVVDNTLGRDETVDFGKLHFANVASANLAPLPVAE